MKADTIKKGILITVIGLLIGCFGRWFTLTHTEIPLYLNYIGPVLTAYYAGPVCGMITSIFTVLFGTLYMQRVLGEPVITEIYFFLPMLFTVLFVGIRARRYKAFESFYRTVGVYALTAVARSLFMVLINGIFTDGRTGLSMCDTIISFMESINGGKVLEYTMPSAVAAFIDSFVSFLVIFVLVKVISLFGKAGKKKNPEAAGKTAAVLAGILAFGLGTIGLSINAEAVSGDNFVQKIYGADNGVTGGAATGIAQTEDGSIWVATYGGLYKFNGTDFDIIRDIPEARSCSSLYTDDKDNLWVASNGTGLVLITSDDRVFTLSDEEGLPSNAVRSVVKVSDEIYYVGTVSELAIVRYDGSSLEMVGTIPDVKYIKRLSTTLSGHVIATSNSGVVYLIKDDEVVDTFSEDEVIYNSYVVSDSEIYLSGGNANLYTVAIRNGKFSIQSVKHIDGMDSIKSVLISSDGIMYVAGSNSIGYFDKNNVFNMISTGDFNSSIERIMEDYQGNIWFTSLRCGLLELSASSFSNLFDTCNVKKEGTNTVKYWNGLIYAGTDKGLYALHEESSTNVENTYTELLADNLVRGLDVDENNHLWISTETTGVYEIVSEDEIYNYNDENGLPTVRSRCSIVMPDGTAVVSTYNGISFISNHEVTKTLRVSEEMKSAYALCLLKADDDTVFAGTNGDGICVIRDGEVDRYITHNDGLPSGIILNLYKDIYGDGYFILTGSGMCYMDSDYNVTEFSEFPFYNNTDIFETVDRKVFVLSTAGIYIVDYDDLMSFGEMNYILLDGKMGLPGSVSSNARNYLSDGNILYFAGSTGVYRLDCSDYYIKVDSYKIGMKTVQFDGQEESVSGDTAITIPAGTQRVSIKLELFNYTATDPYVRYSLSGVDSDAVTVLASELKEIVYFGIPSGNHTLKVEVLSPNKTKVLQKVNYTVTKLSEPYEATSFKHFFRTSVVLMVITMIAFSAIIVIDVNAKRQKIKYNEAMSKMEREKAVALQRSLEREEAANKSKSDFLANMSHEIRTPINAIIGMDTMIIRESSQTEIKNYAENIFGAGKTLLSLINDILDFSKIESGKMELVLSEYNLGMLVNDVIVMMRPKAEAKDLQFNIEVDSEIPVMLYGDEGRIKQIIINILNNAVKYTEKGSVTLKVGYKALEEKKIGLWVCVSDTGIGIKQEDISRLFSPFERIEESRNKNIEGTGLGMSITKNLLALMNSELKVSSVYGQGSDFAFTIAQPVMGDELIGDYRTYATEKGDLGEAPEEFHAPNANILVVDDVEMNLIVFKSLLKRTKVQIDAVDSGMKAIEMAKFKEYDIIFLDAMMPQMSGEETLQHMKAECERNADTPVIMLTANAIKGAREEYLQKGFNNYLSKPIDDKALEDMLWEYIPDDKKVKPGDDAAVAENGNGSATGDGSADAGSDPADAFIQFMSAMPDVDTEKGIAASGGKDTYMTISKNFYETADMRISMIRDLFDKMDVPNYTIQVHALKSSARLVGAIKLSELALSLEMAGKENNLGKIKEDTPEVLRMYEAVYAQLSQFFEATQKAEEEAKPKDEISPKKFKRRMGDIRELLESFDVESAREAFNELKDNFSTPKEYDEVMRRIPGEFAEVNRDKLIELIDSILQ